MSSKIFQHYLSCVQSVVGKNCRFKNNNELAAFVGIAPSQVAKYLHPEETSNINKFLLFFEKIGGGLTFISEDSPETVKEARFIYAKTVPDKNYFCPHKADEYVAIPMLGDVGAGRALLPDSEISVWFFLHKSLKAIMQRRKLIAAKIEEKSDSMSPTLNPGDIVLIDREDKTLSPQGRIMLVLDPLDNDAAMIKRVYINQLKNNDYQIIYHSDNDAVYPPRAYSLNKDFDGEWDRCISGAVIWVWADLRGK